MRNTKNLLVGLMLLIASLAGLAFFSFHPEPAQAPPASKITTGASSVHDSGFSNTGFSNSGSISRRLLALLEDPHTTADNTTTQTKKQNPEKIYDEAWIAIQQNFLYRNRLAKWKQWRHKFDGKLTSAAEAEKAIEKMLSALGDDWTYYKNSRDVKQDQTSDWQAGVVSHKLLNGTVGYIKITTFSSYRTAQETEQAIKSMPKARAFIIDLRENGGGFVYQAFEVFSLLADKGTMTTLKGYYTGGPYQEDYVLEASLLVLTKNGVREGEEPRRANLLAGRPLVVLVNENSASASEILVGALQDLQIATVIGATTYGKGVAQITRELANGGAVRITFAKFFSPHGHCPHGIGITPDLPVDEENNRDAPLEAAIDYLR